MSVRILNNYMFDPHFKYTSTIMASGGLDPTLALFPSFVYERYTVA